MTAYVAIEPCASYRTEEVSTSIQRALGGIGGLETIVQPGDKVLLKPNLLFAKPAENAVTTHPALIESIAKLVIDCGAKAYLGDSPPLPSAHRVTKACGMADVMQRMDIELVEFKKPGTNMRKQPFYAKGIATPALESRLLEFDKVINIPKLKAHQQMVLTCGVKNLFGCVNGRTKAYWHFKLQSSRDAFADMILAVYEKVAPELTIVDGIVSMEGNGPGKGTPKPSHLILAGTEAVAIDRVITELVGLPPQEHPILRAAERHGHPCVHLANIEIGGLSIQEAKLENFLIPKLSPIGFSLAHIINGIWRSCKQTINNRFSANEQTSSFQ